MDRSRRNVLLLALCQAAFISTAALMATIGTLAGHALAANKALATLPATALTVGTALGTIPASLVMRRVGRRLGFIVGSGFTMAGGLVGAWAVVTQSFWLLAAGGFLMGVSSAFAQLYRFAAAEAVTPERRGRAISLVLAGGLLAGFIGPQLAGSTADLLGTRFVASFLCIPLLALASMGLMLGLRLPEAVESRVTGRARSVVAIVRQPLFLVAVVSEMVGYGVMNLLMTGTPLAMVTHHGHGLRDAAFVIEWHLVGMFLPGFFTGSLIQRIGERATIAIGIAVNAGSLAVGFSGSTVWHFWLALLLVGVGWNLMFVRRLHPGDPVLRAQRADEGSGGERLPDLGDGRGDLAVVRTAAPPARLDGDPRDRRPTASSGGRGTRRGRYRVTARSASPSPREA